MAKAQKRDFSLKYKDGKQMQKNEIKAEGLKKVRKIIYGRTLVGGGSLSYPVCPAFRRVYISQ